MASAAIATSPSMSYGNIALPSSGKQGILKKLDSGYVEIILGAFGTFGNGDWLYDTASAMKVFNSDPDFRRMLEAGRLKSEWGHPVRPPGLTDAEWFIRICTIYEPNVSSHIRRVTPSFDTIVDAKGRKVVAIIGEVKGSGPHSREFNESLENPHEDVNYSIRCFAEKNFSNSTKYMKKIVNWDSVTDPGVPIANKYATPSMESRFQVARMLDEAEFDLDRIREGLITPSNDESFESSAKPARAIFQSLYESTTTRIAMPAALAW
jgi:hypothetical protein